MKLKTWHDLVKLEPGLQRLIDDARAIKDEGGPSFCANRHWYQGGLRNRLAGLVGWHAQSGLPELMTQAAYDLAYQTIYRELPGCRNCQCL